jgi:hypothetical protein
MKKLFLFITLTATFLLNAQSKGTMVFAKTRIANENPDAVLLQKEFSGSDMIYARCFLTKPLYITNGDEEEPTESFRMEMYVNDVRLWDVPEVSKALGTNYVYAYFINTTLSKYVKISREEAEKQTSFEIGINHNDNEFIEQPDEKQDKLWPLIANSLKPGVYKIKLKLYGGYKKDQSSSDPISVGEFTYNKKAGAVISSGGVDYKTIAPKAGMSDPALEAEAKALVAAYKTDYEGHKMIKAVLTDKTWTIIKNEVTGKIQSRSMNVWGIMKDKNGICRQIEANLVQKYVNGTYGKTFLGDGFVVDDRAPKVDCSTVK